jgi:nucleotide-binding universal stress UspA family protein
MPQSPVKHIMVYLDGSETCIAAAQYAVFLAKTFDAKLTATYVVDQRILDELVKARIFFKEEALDYEFDLEQDGKRYLNYARELGRAKGIEMDVVLLKGEVHTLVLGKIAEIGADILVVNEFEEFTSRREASYDDKERILRRAKIPVVVVTGETKARETYESM